MRTSCSRPSSCPQRRPISYITIRVKVPESGLTAVKASKPGEWVTVTSRHRPASDAEAVVAVKPWFQGTAN